MQEKLEKSEKPQEATMLRLPARKNGSQESTERTEQKTKKSR